MFYVATSVPKKWKLGSFLIRYYQGWTEFSHVLILDDREELVYQASQGLVNVMYIDNFLEDNKIVHMYPVLNREDVDMVYIKKQLGKKYGFDQILSIALQFILGIRLRDNGDQRLICSEFVGRALKLPNITDKTTPLEIHNYLLSKLD